MARMYEEVQDQAVTLVRGDDSADARLQWWKVMEDNGRITYRIKLTGIGQKFDGAGPDMFEALVEIRRQLEPTGWRIAVQGARMDTYPSGMARDMGGGERVYVLRPRQQAKREDLVDTLEPADAHRLATVDEQAEYFDSWRSTFPGGG